jgi:hypothetical protein
MPTYDFDPRFWIDYDQLSPARRLFRRAVDKLVEDLDRGGPIRASLRVRPMVGHAGIFEMTWAGNDGRAAFTYGPDMVTGKRHIIWRRVGEHEIFEQP